MVLTSDARNLLETALIERLKGKTQAKLTREQRANLLGLSIGTSDRIAKGLSVDRPSLATAFASLGLPWSDEYCKPAEVEENEPESETLLPVSPPSAPRKWQMPALVTAIAAVSVFVTWNLVPKAADPDAWRVPYWAMSDEGTQQFQNGDYGAAEKTFEKALAIARERNDAGSLASTYSMLGQIAEVRGSYEVALDCYTKSKNFRDALKQPKQEPSLYEMTGIVQGKLAMYSEGERNIRTALLGFTREKDRGGMASAYRSFGELEIRRKRYADARKYLEEGLKIAVPMEMADLITDIDSQLAVVDAHEGRVGPAREVARRSLAYWEERRHNRWIARMRIRLSEVESLAGNHALSIELLSGARALYEKVGDLGGLAEADRRLLEVTEALARSNPPQASPNAPRPVGQ